MRGYKKSAALASMALFLCSFCHLPPAGAGEKEDQLVRSVMTQVENISKKTKTLDALGKESFTQSTTILDLGALSLPVLLEVLPDSQRNWKVRYWTADILGYVGNAETAEALLKIAWKKRENKLLRMKALDSLFEIAKKNSAFKKRLKTALRKMQREVHDRGIKAKAGKILKKLKR